MTEQHAIKKPNERPININGVVFHCYEVGRFRIEWRSEDGKKRVGQQAGSRIYWACSNGFYSHRRFYSLYNAMKGNIMELKDFYHPGRMISATKKSPKGHICVFNGNICIKSKGKIWFGDIDLTIDKEKLIELAKECNEPIYILKEMDARFQNESDPKYERAKAVIYPDGLVDIH